MAPLLRRLDPVATLEFRAPPPLSLYVHVPWCVRKCPYCDFNSHEAQAAIPEADYVAALLADLELALPSIWGRRIVSVFIGGGTPSLLSGAAVQTLLDGLRLRLTIVPDVEITLEANPGTAEADKFAAFRDAGVNRLSLGIQSFNDHHLRALGRIHNRAQAERAIELATRLFPRFNLDLMYGLPGQQLAEALADLERALAFTPPHLSCYQLTLEPHTAFAAAPPALPDGDLCADMQDAIEVRLAAASYRHYETSAFAQPGRECAHNLNYWQFGDYLGIGAGAHGKLTFHDHVARQMRWKQPRQYLQQVTAGTPIQDEHTVSAADLPGEFMMNALRLNHGFDTRLFLARSGRSLGDIQQALTAAIQEGLLYHEDNVIGPTLRGQRFLNILLQKFLAVDPL
jgi:putative oxygen-independent coproporphyrinogen III oxidase